MGRFGNVMLVAGETGPRRSSAKRGEVVRLYLTNTANTRVFNVALPGAQMKLVGADAGHYEHEELVEEVLLAPSERVVVDVLFDVAGELTLEHRTPERTYPLASIAVADEPPERSFAAEFVQLRTNHDMAALREQIEPFVRAPTGQDSRVRRRDESWRARRRPRRVRLPDAPGGRERGAGQLPEVRDEAPAGEPRGARRRARRRAPPRTRPPRTRAEARPRTTAGGLEWEDDMVEVNRMTTPANMRWKLVDRDTGAENARDRLAFRVGDQVKLRLVNEMDSDHPMPHPFHVHGAGRFLILARDGVSEPNLVWKDTVLVRTGETVDILLDVTNPGRWMAHCHIAEHHESGMMLGFNVTP